MNIQEREEIDYRIGCATELQNSYAASRLEREPDDTAKIRDLVAAGKFVLVAEVPDYCPRTDAAMGSRCWIASIHDHRVEAMGAHERLPIDEYDETCYRIEPRAPYSQPFSEVSNEIPF